MTRKTKLKIGVIGGGAISQAGHLPFYAKDRGTEIHVATRSRERRDEIEATFPGRIAGFYTDWRRLLREQELDAVSICTPNYLHARNCLAAAERGIHVLCEKPLALTLADGRRMVEACHKNRVVLMVNFTTRFFHGPRRVKRLMEQGRVGDIHSLRIRLVHEGPYANWAKGDWFYDPAKAGGGALMDMGIHAIDICQYLMGPIRSVSASLATLSKEIPLEDSATLTVGFDGDRFGLLEAGWTGGAGFTGIEVNGSKGSIVLDYRKGLSLFLGRARPDGSVDVKEQALRVDPLGGGWGVVIKEFLNHVREGSRPECDGNAGLTALQVALAARKSHKTGRRIRMASA